MRVVAVLIVLVVLAGGYRIVRFYWSGIQIGDVSQCIDFSELDIECARDIIAKLLKSHAPRDLVFQFERAFPLMCHPLGHIVGQEVFRKVGSIEHSYALCSPAGCVSACLHGIVAEALTSAPEFNVSTEELSHPTGDFIRNEGRKLCSDRQACHAVGHVLFSLYMDLSHALNACAAIAQSGTAWDCYSGVFMEDSSATIARTTFSAREQPSFRDPQDLLSPCLSVEGTYQPACFHFLFMNQSVSLRERGDLNSDRALEQRLAACGSLEDPYIGAMCYEGIGWSLFLQRSLLDSRLVCMALSSDVEKDACIFGMAGSYIEFGEPKNGVLEICASFSEERARSACYASVFDALTYRREALSQSMCADREECESALQNYLRDPTDLPVAR